MDVYTSTYGRFKFQVGNDITNLDFFDSVEFLKICREENIPTVPVIEESRPFIFDEIVDLSINGSSGTGQVAYANSSTVTLQHLSGVTTNNSIISKKVFLNSENKVAPILGG